MTDYSAYHVRPDGYYHDYGIENLGVESWLTDDMVKEMELDSYCVAFIFNWIGKLKGETI
jgi:hypothetical protein